MTTAETHSAFVVFVGDRAYKVKKPVDLGFLDFTTPARRREACERELRLNRRIAPDVYDGLLSVHDESGAEVDTVLVMRRLPDDRRLATLVSDGTVPPACVDDVAHVVAAFHAGCGASPAKAHWATAAAVRSNWDDSVEALARFAGRLVDPGTADRVRDLAHRYLDGRDPLFGQRIEDGHVRDGHGDLLADDIFCLADGPRIIDCLDFDDRYRYADVLADVAFLVMDLERLGAPELATRFLARYRELTAETWPASLADHYVAYRAHVRAKVACLRAEQAAGTAPGDAPDATHLLELARSHLERARVRLVLVGGPPGTGKSTLARALGDETGWALLRSDEVRDELFARDGPAALGEGRYRPDRVKRVYGALLDRARRALSHGVSVIADASWSDPHQRARAAAVADETSSDLTALRCQTRLEVALERVRDRAGGDDPSEAGPEVVRALTARFPSWPDAILVSTDPPVHEVRDHVRGLLEDT